MTPQERQDAIDALHAAPSMLLALAGALLTLPAIMSSDSPQTTNNPWIAYFIYAVMGALPVGAALAFTSGKLLRSRRSFAVRLLWLLPIGYAAVVILLFKLAANWQSAHYG